MAAPIAATSVAHFRQMAVHIPGCMKEKASVKENKNQIIW
jgi:hypothetical protein